MKEEVKIDQAPVEENNDSFGFSIKKNPWLLYSLAHIPILLIMVVILCVLYQGR